MRWRRAIRSSGMARRLDEAPGRRGRSRRARPDRGGRTGLPRRPSSTAASLERVESRGKHLLLHFDGAAGPPHPPGHAGQLAPLRARGALAAARPRGMDRAHGQRRRGGQLRRLEAADRPRGPAAAATRDWPGSVRTCWPTTSIPAVATARIRSAGAGPHARRGPAGPEAGRGDRQHLPLGGLLRGRARSPGRRSASSPTISSRGCSRATRDADARSGRDRPSAEPRIPPRRDAVPALRHQDPLPGPGGRLPGPPTGVLAVSLR